MQHAENERSNARADLAQRRAALEMEKLEIEVKRLRHPIPAGLREVAWKDIAAIIVAVIGIALAWSTGLFNARRERLAAATDRLQIEKEALERGNAELAETRAALNAENARLRQRKEELENQVNVYEEERVALKSIMECGKRRDNMITQVAFSSGIEELEITVQPFVFWPIVTGREEPEPTPRIGELLRLMQDIPRLTSLRIMGFALTEEDSDTLGRLDHLQRLSLHWCTVPDDVLACLPSQLSSLSLAHCDLSDKRVALIPQLSELRELQILGDKNIRVPRALCRLSSLESLNLAGTSFDDEGISSLTPMNASLRNLVLNETGVSDEAVDCLNEFGALKSLSIRDTKISALGLSKLDLDFLGLIYVSRAVLSEDVVEVMRRKMPGLIVEKLPRDVPAPPLPRFYW